MRVASDTASCSLGGTGLEILQPAQVCGATPLTGGSRGWSRRLNASLPCRRSRSVCYRWVLSLLSPLCLELVQHVSVLGGSSKCGKLFCSNTHGWQDENRLFNPRPCAFARQLTHRHKAPVSRLLTLNFGGKYVCFLMCSRPRAVSVEGSLKYVEHYVVADSLIQRCHLAPGISRKGRVTTRSVFVVKAKDD